MHEPREGSQGIESKRHLDKPPCTWAVTAPLCVSARLMTVLVMQTMTLLTACLTMFHLKRVVYHSRKWREGIVGSAGLGANESIPAAAQATKLTTSGFADPGK